MKKTNCIVRHFTEVKRQRLTPTSIWQHNSNDCSIWMFWTEIQLRLSSNSQMSPLMNRKKLVSESGITFLSSRIQMLKNHTGGWLSTRFSKSSPNAFEATRTKTKKPRNTKSEFSCEPAERSSPACRTSKASSPCLKEAASTNETESNAPPSAGKRTF